MRQSKNSNSAKFFLILSDFRLFFFFFSSLEVSGEKSTLLSLCPWFGHSDEVIPHFQSFQEATLVFFPSSPYHSVTVSSSEENPFLFQPLFPFCICRRAYEKRSWNSFRLTMFHLDPCPGARLCACGTVANVMFEEHFVMISQPLKHRLRTFFFFFLLSLSSFPLITLRTGNYLSRLFAFILFFGALAASTL